MSGRVGHRRLCSGAQSVCPFLSPMSTKHPPFLKMCFNLVYRLVFNPELIPLKFNLIGSTRSKVTAKSNFDVIAWPVYLKPHSCQNSDSPVNLYSMCIWKQCDPFGYCYDIRYLRFNKNPVDFLNCKLNNSNNSLICTGLFYRKARQLILYYIIRFLARQVHQYSCVSLLPLDITRQLVFLPLFSLCIFSVLYQFLNFNFWQPYNTF